MAGLGEKFSDTSRKGPDIVADSDIKLRDLAALLRELIGHDEGTGAISDWIGAFFWSQLHCIENWTALLLIRTFPND